MLDYQSIDRVFQALAEPQRRAILERLSHGPASVADLAKPLDITLAAVLQHVQALERGGLIRTEKVGRVRTCSIDPEGLNVLQAWIDRCRTMWERRFDRLGQILTEESTEREEKS
jgi:DNA-binding transcriptional ArsR family regulator